jgi:hypothetical protein
MKRFAIFVVLFPILALAGLVAFLSIEVGALADNMDISAVGWAYVVGIIPALILALVDRFLGRIIVTTLVGYLIGILIALAFFDWGLVARILTFALIGAVPAVVCSWLSGKTA